MWTATRWVLGAVIVVGLGATRGVLAEGPAPTPTTPAGDKAGAPTAPTPAPVGPAVAAPEPAVPAPGVPKTRPERPRPAPLRPPDGTFGGTVTTPGGAVAVRLVVTGGMLVDGEATLPDGATLPLGSSDAPDALPLRLSGQDGRDYLRLKVDFFDQDRGAGTCEGVLARKRFSGAWAVERR